MRRVIRRHVRRRAGGIDLAVDVNAVVSVNHGTSGVQSVQSTSVTSVTQDASARAAEEGRERPADNPDPSPEEER